MMFVASHFEVSCLSMGALCLNHGAFCLGGVLTSYMYRREAAKTAPTKPQNRIRWWSLPTPSVLNPKTEMVSLLNSHPSTSSKKMTVRFKTHFSCLSSNADSC